MLVDQLRVSIASQQHTKVVEPGHYTLKLHPVDEDDGPLGLVLAYVLEKGFRQDLSLVRHGRLAFHTHA